MITLDTSVLRSAPRMPTSGRVLCALLNRLEVGGVELTTPEGATLRFGPGGAPAPGIKSSPAVLTFRDWGVAGAALRGGDVAFAESYMEGRWDTPDLTQLSDGARGQPVRARARLLWPLVVAVTAAAQALPECQQQAPVRGRTSIAHYDLGNAFYRLWLDPTMTYSSALYDGRFDMDLAAAQQAKYSRLLGELALAPDAHILEIGCGWGGFAEMAARAGHRVTGISLSDAQTAFAQERLARAGLGGPGVAATAGLSRRPGNL